MRSHLSKPLHPVAGQPMIAHVLHAVAAAAPVRTALVVSPELHDLPQRLGLGSDTVAVVQDPPRGTGDALRVGLAAVPAVDYVLVVFADHPLLDGQTVRRLLDAAVSAQALVTLLSVRVATGAYGRVDHDPEGRPRRIVERQDEVTARPATFEANSGMLALDAPWARTAVQQLTPSPATGEIYLTDLVDRAVRDHAGGTAPWPVAAVAGDPRVALGINDRAELATADMMMRQDIRSSLMRGGVSLIGPETIFIDAGVSIAPDTTVLPFSIISGPTTIGRGCTIGPHAVIHSAQIGDRVRIASSTVEDATIGSGSDVGPYSHLRAGTVLEGEVHVGNFAEIKNGHLEERVKVGHVSYLGDCHIGAATNVGAGTVTANFDGVHKHRTEIGPNVFLGSDTILRAPLHVGAGARTGAGSVVTKDVAPGATVVGVPARPIGSRHPAPVAAEED